MIKEKAHFVFEAKNNQHIVLIPLWLISRDPALATMYNVVLKRVKGKSYEPLRMCVYMIRNAATILTREERRWVGLDK